MAAVCVYVHVCVHVVVCVYVYACVRGCLCIYAWVWGGGGGLRAGQLVTGFLTSCQPHRLPQDDFLSS